MTSARLERSNRSLEAARLLLQQGFYEQVFPLAFHAAENAVREVLSQVGISSKTHASTLREFGRLLIERRLDEQGGAALNRLLRGRQDIIYRWGEASKEDAERATEDARRVVEAARVSFWMWTVDRSRRAISPMLRLSPQERLTPIGAEGPNLADLDAAHMAQIPRSPQVLKRQR